MKSSKEIEKLAKENIFTEEGQVGFVLGYNRCLKDFNEQNNNNTNKLTIISEWQLCPKCYGEGVVDNIGSSTSLKRTCPVCNGSKLLIKPTKTP